MSVIRLSRLARIALISLFLGGCVAAPALLLPSQKDIMLKLLLPMVGLDPNATNLFEQPVVKQRMTALLGSHYDTTMKLLRTANTLQREGPLFFVVSRYTPVPALAQKAGFVWNADTNQMAVALLEGDNAGRMLYEAVEQKAGAVVEQAETAAKQRVADEQAKVEHTVDEKVGGEIRKVIPTWPHEISDWLHPERVIQESIQRRVDDAAAGAVDAATGTR